MIAKILAQSLRVQFFCAPVYFGTSRTPQSFSIQFKFEWVFVIRPTLHAYVSVIGLHIMAWWDHTAGTTTVATCSAVSVLSFNRQWSTRLCWASSAVDILRPLQWKIYCIMLLLTMLLLLSKKLTFITNCNDFTDFTFLFFCWSYHLSNTYSYIPVIFVLTSILLFPYNGTEWPCLCWCAAKIYSTITTCSAVLCH